MTEESILLLDDYLTNDDATINALKTSECVGEYSAATAAVRALVLHGDSRDPKIKALQQAFVTYFKTDIKAAEIAQAQANSDWIDSGRGQQRKVA